MSDINISVDTTDLLAGKRSLEELENTFTKVLVSIVRDQKRLELAGRQTANTLEAATRRFVGTLEKDYLKAVGQQIQLMERSKAAAERQAATEARVTAALEKQALARQRAKSDTAFALGKQRAEEEAKALREATLAAENRAATEERLKLKYNTSYAAMQLYKQEVNELNLALSTGAISQVRYAELIGDLNQQLKAGTGTFQRFTDHTNQAGGSANQFGVFTQQAGYQVGDFLVQVQSGTNWMVAFGQQATQLVGVLPMLSGTLGVSSSKLMAWSAGLGIAIPLITAIGAYFLRSSENADKAKDSLSELEQQLKSLDSTLAQWMLENEAAGKGIVIDILLGQKGVQGVQEELDKAEAAYRKAFDNLQSLNERGLLSSGALFTGSRLVTAAEEELKKFEEEYKAALERMNNLQAKQAAESIRNFTQEKRELLEKQAIEQASLRYGENSLKVRELIAAQERRIYEESVRSRVENDRMVDALMRQYDEGVKVTGETAKFKDELGRAYLEALNISTVNMESGVNKAAEAARVLANNLGISLSAAMSMVDLAEKGGIAFKNSPAYDPLNKGSSFNGNETTSASAAWKLRNWVSEQGIGGDSSGRGGNSASNIKEIIAERRAQIEQDYVLLNLSERKQEAERIYFELLKENKNSSVKLTEAELRVAANIEAANLDRNNTLEKQIELQRQIAETIESSMEDAFMSTIERTKSVEDAFRDMAKNIISELYRVLVVQRMVGSVSGGTGLAGLLGGLFMADGGAFSAGRQIKAYANGGVIGGPTYFPMAGGKTGLMGEAGPEAIMPLKRTSDGKLGVAVSGNSNNSVVVNNNISVNGNSDPSAIRTEIARLLPQITEATKAAVIDARRRGGQMKSAFN